MDYVGVVAKLARRRRNGATAWAILVGLFALCVAARLAGGRQLDPTPFIPFVPALPIATLACGWFRAVVFLAASIGVGSIFDDPGALISMTPPLGFRVGVVFALGAFLIALTEVLTRTVERLEATARLNADLFRELQHRVANNFQIVAATLHVARRQLGDPVAAAVVEHTIARIDALGRLHRRLYDPQSYSGGIEPVLRDVLADAFSAYDVETALDLRSDGLTVGQMTDIVLLVGEAALNAAKHAFASRRGGRFVVSLHSQTGTTTLAICDDGPGFAPESAPGKRFGLEIMNGLAARLGGRLEVLDGPGARLRVSFAA